MALTSLRGVGVVVISIGIWLAASPLAVDLQGIDEATRSVIVLEAFVKPEIVAPGGRLRAMMKPSYRLASDHPQYHDGGEYFTMSGTSQAAAVPVGDRSDRADGNQHVGGAGVARR